MLWKDIATCISKAPLTVDSQDLICPKMKLGKKIYALLKIKKKKKKDK